MVWIELTDDEVRAARIEAMAMRSAGLHPDPLIVAMAKAEPHTADWVTRQEAREQADVEGFEPTNEISHAMDYGLTTLVEAEQSQTVQQRRADEQERAAREREHAALRGEAAHGGWILKLWRR